jgi:hypothetical protein
MRDWRNCLAALATEEPARLSFPLSVFQTARPSGIAWSDELPFSETVADVYKISDGGYLGPNFNFPTLTELQDVNHFWVKTLRDWDDDGDVLNPDHHLVLATDAGGCPIILDTRTGAVAAFQFDGGSWEPPLAKNAEGFFEWLFNPDLPPDDMWLEALVQLDSLMAGLNS